MTRCSDVKSHIVYTSLRAFHQRYSIYGHHIFAVIIAYVCCTSTVFCQLTYSRLNVLYDSPWVCGNLQLIPLTFRDTGASAKPAQAPVKNIISFEEALKEGKVTVKEMTMPGGSDVGMLTIKNHSKKNVLIESGEMIAGGKQDRIFAETSVIPPTDEEFYLPVFCVEKGRWDNRVRSFRYAGPANASLRKQINIAKKQNKVWKEIDKQLTDESRQNKTSAYLNLYKDSSGRDSACLAFFRSRMKQSDSLYAGFVAVTGNRIINCELFGNSDLCLTSFETMLKGYLRSVQDKTGSIRVNREEVKNFLDKFLQSESQQQKYLAGHGAVFTYNKEVIHLIAYPD